MSRPNEDCLDLEMPVEREMSQLQLSSLASGPRLFDCFTFFNEFELLEVRLNELAPLVSCFVIAEAPMTFQGHPKPLYFLENRSRFAKFADRICHVIVTGMPVGSREADHWRREHYQRNALARATADASPDDYVMLSDVDEIPRASAVRAILSENASGPIVHLLELEMFRFYLNFRQADSWLRNGPRLTRRRYVSSFQALRNTRPPDANPINSLWRWARASAQLACPIRRNVVHNAGWHFSSLGGVEAYAEKLRSFSHVLPERRALSDEAMLDVAANQISDALKQERGEIVSIDQSFPAFIVDNPEKFRPLVHPAIGGR
jgi:beta-1,4-mannosyl-glycoprotein beta-1,4-N-acetylglucosaminyltransferase